jgi:hypothetical protein
MAWLFATKAVEGPRVESRLVRKEGLRWPRLVRRGFSLGYSHISIGWRAVIVVEECTMDLADIL